MTNHTNVSNKFLLAIAIFIAGLCSIIYELLISTTSSYFLGDSIKQFSITIGIYMASMGIGSFFSKFLEKQLLLSFIVIEICLGIIGGLSVPILYYSFEWLSRTEYSFLMIFLTFLIGTLTGFEIPLLVRVMKMYYPLKVNLANVFSLDYFGALLATLIFPFFLLPYLGIFRTSLFFGLVNIILGWLILLVFHQGIGKTSKIVLNTISILIPLGFLTLFVYAKPLLAKWDDQWFTHRIVFTKQTPYQNLVVTKNNEDIRLYINRIIQFSSLDEYRYHESLALIPLNAAKFKEKVLVLGGGEGLLVRELLKDTTIQQIDVVDLDEAVLQLGLEHPYIKELNNNSFTDPRVHLIPGDAAVYLQTTNQLYDVILADLPDPSNDAVARLYSTFFYQLIQQKLSRFGVFATQATGTFHTNNAFWCIYESIKASEFDFVYPYHAYVPSFGDWGFILAANYPLSPAIWKSEYSTKYLDSAQVSRQFRFEKDIQHPGDILPNP